MQKNFKGKQLLGSRISQNHYLLYQDAVSIWLALGQLQGVWFEVGEKFERKKVRIAEKVELFSA